MDSHSNEKEVWKDVPKYEGYYQVSSTGFVRSLDRVVVRTTGSVQDYKGKVLKSFVGTDGYLILRLSKLGVVTGFKVHKLIAITFLDHIPNRQKGLVVDHINNIKTDNRLVNLQIITHRENCVKDKKKGTSKYVGVRWCKVNSIWMANIYINGKRIYLGQHRLEIDAHLAYQKALKNI